MYNRCVSVKLAVVTVVPAESPVCTIELPKYVLNIYVTHTYQT